MAFVTPLRFVETNAFWYFFSNVEKVLKGVNVVTRVMDKILVYGGGPEEHCTN